MATENLSLGQREPVRIIGYITTALILAGSIAKQVADSWDEGTGWTGLAFAVVMIISTELARARVTPVAKQLAAGSHLRTPDPGEAPSP